MFLRHIARCSKYCHRPSVSTLLCAVAVPPPPRFVHVSAVSHGRKRRAREPIKFQPKVGELVKLWYGATMTDLALAADIEEETVRIAVQKCLLHEEYSNASMPIKSEHLQLICKRLGLRLMGITNPNDQLKELNSEDVHRRPPPAHSTPRPPVVTIMGHVDHGKTTLLDALRSSNVVASEFGGITQHIGAFSVTCLRSPITFIDTPGHAAFAQMRQRGANATDIVVLVVAAEDGVMEQTIDSIKYARNAGVPFVVAINKCDRPDADIDRTKQMLYEQGIETEDYGGDVISVNISALKRTNLDELQEAILTQAELLDLRGDPKGLAEGVVLESRVGKGIGNLCTVLVQRGRLRRGSVLVCGRAWCKVKALYDDKQRPIKQANLCDPVEVAGWKDVLPDAGDEVLEVESEAVAKRVIAYRNRCAMDAKAEMDSHVIDAKRQKDHEEYLELRDQRRTAGYRFLRKATGDYEESHVNIHAYDPEIPHLNLMIKADVAGSLEALVEVLDSYAHHDQCVLTVVDFDVGPVTVADVERAHSDKSSILAFHTELEASAKVRAAELDVAVHEHNVIYHMVHDVQHMIDTLLPLIAQESVHGEGQVLDMFRIKMSGNSTRIPVAGTLCNSGNFTLKHKYRITSASTGKVVYDGMIDSMKVARDSVTMVTPGEQVGLMVGVDHAHDELTFAKGDKVIAYDSVMVPQHTRWQPRGFTQSHSR